MWPCLLPGAHQGRDTQQHAGLETAAPATAAYSCTQGPALEYVPPLLGSHHHKRGAIPPPIGREPILATPAHMHSMCQSHPRRCVWHHVKSQPLPLPSCRTPPRQLLSTIGCSPCWRLDAAASVLQPGGHIVPQAQQRASHGPHTREPTHAGGSPQPAGDVAARLTMRPPPRPRPPPSTTPVPSTGIPSRTCAANPTSSWGDQPLLRTPGAAAAAAALPRRHRCGAGVAAMHWCSSLAN